MLAVTDSLSGTTRTPMSRFVSGYCLLQALCDDVELRLCLLDA